MRQGDILPVSAVHFPVRERGDVCNAANVVRVDLAAFRDSDRAAAVDGLSEAASARARNMITAYCLLLTARKLNFP